MTNLFGEKQVNFEEFRIDTGQAEIRSSEGKASFMAEELEKVFTPGKPGSKTPAVELNREKWMDKRDNHIN
jgi:hypothetical protein